MQAAAPISIQHDRELAPGVALDAIIHVENFSAEYDGNTVLKDVSFDVRRGEVLVIAGGSGSGKSTLLKHMIGLYRPARGRILIEGADLAAAPPHERERILRLFGVSFQGGRSLKVSQPARMIAHACTT